MSEASHQSKLIKKLEKEGWYVLKLIKTNKGGIPDLLALKKNEKPFFIEVKASDGVLQPLQRFRIKELKELGFKAIVSYEEPDK